MTKTADEILASHLNRIPDSEQHLLRQWAEPAAAGGYSRLFGLLSLVSGLAALVAFGIRAPRDPEP
ncbi:hypothetical protein ABZZ47_30675 [Streptomyces sp. NPDC006465]|uniref:hypothetical protein n=1 Tax=Streptomyces sp. NPDC006465 TaxID=3157174 RepID=UPI0033ADF7C5